MKYKHLVAAFVLGLLGLWLGMGLIRRGPHQPTTTSPTGSGPDLDASAPATIHAPLAGDSLDGQPPQPFRIMRPGSLEAARKAFPAIAPERLADGRSFILLDTGAARRLQVGDLFQVDLPGRDTPAVAAITHVVEVEDMRRMTGEFVGTDASHRAFSLTISADAAYAAGNFQMDSDAYTLEANHGAGWLLGTGIESEHLLSEEGPAKHVQEESIR